MKIIDKVLRFLYGCLFFLTPLIFTFNTSELFEFNKMLFIYLMTILIAFLWLSKMILAKKIIFKKTKLDLPILFFLSSQILSTIFSIDRHVSLFGYYGRFNGGLLSTVSYILLYYGFVSNSIGTDFILKSSLWSSFLVMLYGLPGKLGHDITCFLVTGGAKFDNSCWDNSALQFQPSVRTFSTLGQPNWLGAFLAINFFIGLYYLIKNIKEVKFVLLNFSYLLFNLSFILFTRSKSALGAVGIGLLIFLSYYLTRVKTDTRKIILMSFLVLVIPVILFKTGFDKVDNILNLSFLKRSSVKVVGSVKTKPVSSPGEATDSLAIREIVWRGAVALGLKYPLFGTGLETFAYSYYLVRPVAHNLTSEWDFVYNKAHNEFLNYLATSGFLGLVTYLLMIGIVIYCFFPAMEELESKKQLDGKSLLLLALLSGYSTILVTNFFGFSTTTINIFFYLIPGLLFVIYQGEDNVTQQLNKVNPVQWLGILVAFAMVIYLTFSLVSYWIADTYYALGLNYSNLQIADYQKSANYFQQALKLRIEPVYEDRFSSSLSYLAAVAAYQKQTDTAKQLIILSDFYNQRSLVGSPKNVFYWKTRAKNEYLFYEVTSDVANLNEGIKALEVSQALAPTDPKIPYSLSVYYSLLYDQEKDAKQKVVWKNKSIAEIEQALKLKKDFQDASTFKQDLLKKYSLL